MAGPEKLRHKPIAKPTAISPVCWYVQSRPADHILINTCLASVFTYIAAALWVCAIRVVRACHVCQLHVDTELHVFVAA